MEPTGFIEASDQLHERVQGFARGTSEETFEELALRIARFQERSSAGFRRLLKARGASLGSVDDIPAVPVDAFRLTRVAVHPPELDRVRFVTSGTTLANRGVHAMRRTDTYEQLSLHSGRHALLPEPEHAKSAPFVVVALAVAPVDPPTSSLGYMLAQFMQSFDAPALERGSSDGALDWNARWLVSDAGVDLGGLRHATALAARTLRPVLLLATAFALVQMLEQLNGKKLPLPFGSVVMQTGGFKGRTREVSAEALLTQVSTAFGLDSARVVGEYGMTELSSQLYEPTITESGLGRSFAGALERVYVEPPWLRVTPVDPLTLLPLPAGEVGLARFVDLGNIDSAVSVVTQDLVRRKSRGIELLGRQPGAPARGCSLSMEALLRG